MTWKDRGALAIAIAVAILVFSTLAASASQCGPTVKVLHHLKTKYDEDLIGQGVVKPATGPTYVAHLLMAPDGSWTFLHSFVNGYSCIRAAGEGWDRIPKTESKPDGPPA